MSKAKQLVIKESVSELKQLLNRRSVTISSRIRMLIAIKNSESESLSKRKLGELLGVSSSSIQIWRKLYEEGGLSLLLEDKRIGFKPSIINKEEHEKIKEILNNPTNGLRGYVELQDYIDKEFGKSIKYNTLLKYCGKHFESKSKVARKSHIKKDPQAVEDLKKTSD
jgi:Transposase and inactivated derivatives